MRDNFISLSILGYGKEDKRWLFQKAARLGDHLARFTSK
jgi:hypothetical protein